MATFSLSDAAATKFLYSIYIFFEQLWKKTPKVTFLLSLAEVGPVDMEEMSLEAKI